jgi:hypothetical protein
MPMANILPNDNSNITYELAIKPSGAQWKVSLVTMKADELFGMVGGAFLVMFFLAGLLARPYR